jgi:hypothetical protein
MAKLLYEYEWNTRFYAMCELDSGSRIELKSKTGQDFAVLLERYNLLSKIPIVDYYQRDLDSYAKQVWPALAKAAEKILPFTVEKTIAEWVDKAVAVSPPTADIIAEK